VSVTIQQLTWHNIAEALNLQVKDSPIFYVYFHFYVQTALSICCSISTQKLFFNTQLCWELNLSLPSPVKLSYKVWWISTYISKDSAINILKVKDTVDHEMQKNKEQEGVFSPSSVLLWQVQLWIMQHQVALKWWYLCHIPEHNSFEYSGTLGCDTMWLCGSWSFKGKYGLHLQGFSSLQLPLKMKATFSFKVLWTTQFVT
jgi:hypothetical protein